MKLLLGDLNPGLCPPHPISTYICEVTIALRVYGSGVSFLGLRTKW